MRKYLALVAMVFDTTLSILWALPPADVYVKGFHQRLTMQEPDWFQDTEVVRCLYTVIENPVLSTPATEGINQYEALAVSFSGEPLERQSDGTYRRGSLSFKLPDLPHLTSLSTQTSQSIVVTCAGQERSVSFKPVTIFRKPVLRAFGSFDEFISKAGTSWLMYEVTWKGTLPPGDGDDDEESGGDITFRSLYKNHLPLRPRGMAVTYRKDTHKTRLFFDFSGAADQDFTRIYYKEIDHRKETGVPDRTIYRVIDHRLRTFNARDVTYNIFDLPASRASWVPAQRQFYSSNGQTIPFLHLYAACTDGGRRDESVVWAFREDGPSDVFYEVDGVEVPLATTHIYSNGTGVLFLTRHLGKGYKEYCPNGGSGPTQTFEYLTVVPKLSLAIWPDQHIVGGHSIWPEGAYRREVSGQLVQWFWEGPGGGQIVAHHISPSAEFNLSFPVASPEESYLQCDSAQRSWWLNFPAIIYSYNGHLLDGFKTWNRLTNLKLDRLKDGNYSSPLSMNGSDWSRVLSAVGTMTQLTSLSFYDNSLILNFNEDYDKLAERVSEYHVQLGECLGKLVHLKTLDIHGLWLRPRPFLGDINCAVTNKPIDKEIAMTTGIVNHRNQRGIRKILESLYGLPVLETLSMDAVPKKGSSYFSRRDGSTQFLASPWFVLTFLAATSDGYDQCAALKKLATEAAQKLGQKTSLRSVSVYAPESGPKDRCSDYFSKFFLKKLSAQNHSSLTVIGPRVLS